MTEVNFRAWPFFPLPNLESLEQPQAHIQELFSKSILGDLDCQDVQYVRKFFKINCV